MKITPDITGFSTYLAVINNKLTKYSHRLLIMLLDKKKVLYITDFSFIFSNFVFYYEVTSQFFLLFKINLAWITNEKDFFYIHLINNYITII